MCNGMVACETRASLAHRVAAKSLLLLLLGMFPTGQASVEHLGGVYWGLGTHSLSFFLSTEGVCMSVALVRESLIQSLPH
ncbi:hypothetical protein PO909_010941 [Leuciscus waleckii]